MVESGLPKANQALTYKETGTANNGTQDAVVDKKVPVSIS